MSEVLRKAAELAIFLNDIGITNDMPEALDMRDKLLAEISEQDEHPEPVAWMSNRAMVDGYLETCDSETSFYDTPLYTTPPAPKRLSDDVIEKIRQSEWCYMLNKQEFRDLVRVIENAVRGG